MGCDGGTIQKHSEMVKKKKKEEKKDNNELARIKYTSCTISREPLDQPIVADHLGNLFNKEALLKAILEKRIPKDLSHITGLKDVFEIHPNTNPNFQAKKEKTKNTDFLIDNLSADMPFACPLTDIEIGGRSKFYVLSSCGCMLSEKALKEIGKMKFDFKSLINNNNINNNNNNNNNNNRYKCLVCGKEFTLENLIPLTTDTEEISQLRQRYLEKKQAQKKKKKTSSTDESALKKGKIEIPISGSSIVNTKEKKEAPQIANLSSQAISSVYGTKKKNPTASSNNLFTLNTVEN